MCIRDRQLVVEAFQILLMTNCQRLIAYDEVHCCFDHRALLIEASGHVVCLCIVAVSYTHLC